jgi:carboxymethylenebutenolidase
MGVGRLRDSGVLLGRRQFLHQLLLGGAGTVLMSGFGRSQGRGLAWAAAPPALPGAPPDKQDASGITIPPTDPALIAGMVKYPGVITPLEGYLSAPAGSAISPGVLVLHDVGGLTEHYKDLTRRLAKIGYIALALDLFSRVGGTAKLDTPSKIQAALSTIAPSQFFQDINSSVLYLEALPLAAKTRIGTIGVGMGGGLLWFLLAQNEDIKAAVLLSASIPSASAVPRLSGAILAIFGEAERQDSKEIEEFDSAMKSAGLDWAYKIEPKAGRGFFDDSRDRYVPDAAKDAWQLTLEWFTKHLAE